VVRGDGDDRAERDAGEFEVVGDLEGSVADGDDDPGGDRDEVDRLAKFTRFSIQIFAPSMPIIP
jgi:hypothetical protein